MARVSVVLIISTTSRGLGGLIRSLRRAWRGCEVIAVDGTLGSQAMGLARSAGARPVGQSILGIHRRGVAMRDGFLLSSGEVVVFLDPGFEGLSPGIVGELVSPIMDGELDVVKGSPGSALSEIESVLKSLLTKLYPGLGVEHPLGLLVAGTRKAFSTISWESGWASEVVALLDPHRAGLRVSERILRLRIGSRLPRPSREALPEIVEALVRRARLDGVISSEEAEKMVSNTAGATV